MNTNKTLTITLNEDHISALEAMVELGTADRREFLSRYAEENDWTNEQIAQGHYEADCADEAIRRLNEACVESPSNAATYLLKDPSKGDRGYWSDEHGWVNVGLADRYTSAQITNCARRDSLASIGIEADFVPAPEHHTDGSGWVIYSPSEAATGTGGFWNIQKGWVEREDATWYPSCLAGSYSLPQSLGQDRNWMNLNLADIRTEKGLSLALQTFCTANALPQQCAAELLSDPRTVLTSAQSLWLEQFCRQWEAAVEAAA